jgi:hypothetical protein
MKNILGLTFLALLSVNSFAKTCVVAQSVNSPSDYDNNIATYTNVENSKHSIMTIIKKNGEVLTDVNMETFYDGLHTQEEIEARTAELYESQVAMIVADKVENQLTLAIGSGTVDKGEMLNSSVMSLSDLTSSKSAVFDTDNKLAIYCVDQ